MEKMAVNSGFESGTKIVSPKGIKVQKRKVRATNIANETGSLSNNPSQLLNHASHLKNAHMNEIKKRKRDFFKRINYHHTLTVAILPVLAFIYLIEFQVPLIPMNTKTFTFACIYFNFTLLAFTSGYHKCFAHNAFRTKYRFLHLYFLIFGSSLGLGSVRSWAALHRAHHQYTDDTERDPFSIKRGLLWAHWGWLIRKPKIVRFYEEFVEQEFPKTIQARNIVNEVNNPHAEDIEFEEAETVRSEYNNTIQYLILLQEKYYHLFFYLTTFIIPILVTVYFCQDTWINGLLYPGILRMLLCQQCQLSTESICHFRKIQVTIPSQPFNDKNSSLNCNNPLISLLTYGQSQQNYHHEFPHDYRESSSYFAFDPTKWFLWTLSKIGWIEELCQTPENLVMQLKIQQQQEIINRLKSQLNWGTPISKLPLIKPSEFNQIISSPQHDDRIYIVIQNIIHDVTPFADQHPGGIPLLKASRGKDATKAFYGGVYGHSTAAVNLLATMRIGVLDQGNDEEVWRRVVREEGEVNENDSRRENKSSYRTAEAA